MKEMDNSFKCRILRKGNKLPDFIEIANGVNNVAVLILVLNSVMRTLGRRNLGIYYYIINT